MHVRRRGDHYQGTLTRLSDGRSLPFAGLLEFLAVLERLTPRDPETPAGEHPAAPSPSPGDPSPQDPIAGRNGQR